MFGTRRVQLVCVLAILLAGLAAPGRVDAQIDPDLVSIDLSQQPAWTGEVWPGDFNRDSITDVTFLTTPARGSALAWARGLGNGSFDAPQAIATGTGTPIGIGDVDQDGFADIVTSSHIVPGRGDGTFNAPVAYLSASEASQSQVVDVNGDGLPDVVTLTTTLGIIRIHPGNGDFTFAPATTILVGPDPESMIVVDLNGDGVPDIANTSKDTARALQLHINAGNATFATMNVPLANPGGGVSARDMNGDGVVDLIVGTGSFDFGRVVWTSGQVSVFLGAGGGAFATPLTFPTLAGPIRIALGDFNADGVPDVATGNQTRVDWLDPVDRPCELFAQLWASVSVLLGRGDGTLGPAASFAMGDGIAQTVMRRLNTSDLNSDGRTDLLFTGSSGAIVLLKPPTENRPPIANAGPDRFLFGPGFIPVFASATDLDHDWLTFEWRDQFGRLVGALPRGCMPVGGPYLGPHEFTFAARDQRGGEGRDTMVGTFSFVSPRPIPSGFTGEGIGDVGAAPGTDSYLPPTGVFSVSGGGADIWGTADAFRFVHRSVTGNLDVVARVQFVEDLDPWTKAGLMIREQLTAGSRHAFLFATPTEVNGVAFQRRQVENGESVHTSGPAMRAPVWLRLVREGNLISAYYTSIATDPWVLIGTQMLSGLNATVYVGMAVTSHRDGIAATASFSNVAVWPSSLGPSPLPSGWETRDVGTVNAAGSVYFDATLPSHYAVRGSGADVWDNADAFRFVYVRATGDGAMTARVTNLLGPHEWSKAGLMIRQSLAADSVHHYLLASVASGLAYQRRVETGGTSLHTALGGAVPVWFHVVRNGGNVRLYYSTEPDTPTVWQPITETPFPEGEMFVGLAVTSHVDGEIASSSGANRLTIAEFDDVSHNFASAPGWTAADVGAVGLPGAEAFDGTTHTLEGSGSDIWDTADAFHFKYQSLPADGTIVARVTSLTAGDPWAKAGVMIRSSTDPSSDHGFALVSRANGVAFQFRPGVALTTVHHPGPAGQAPVWLRLTRNNTTVTAEASFDGSNWITMGSRSALDGPVLVGLALTSHDNTALATATFDNVTVTTSP